MKQEKIVILLGAALFISMTANLFMTGLMLGHSFTPRPGVEAQDDDHAAWKKRDEQLRKSLSPEDRAVLKDTMQANRSEFMALRQQLTAAQKHVEETLNAKPFDQSALNDAMAAEQQSKLAVLSKMRAVRDEISQKLSPEGRAILEKTGPFSKIDPSRLDGKRDRDGKNGRPPQDNRGEFQRQRPMMRGDDGGMPRPGEGAGAISGSDHPFVRDGGNDAQDKPPAPDTDQQVPPQPTQAAPLPENGDTAP